MESGGRLMSEMARLLDNLRLLWDNLELQVPSGNTPATDHDPAQLKIADGAHVGLDLRDRLHLILCLADPDEEMRKRLTAGIVVRTKEFTIDGRDVKAVQIVAEHRWRFAIESFSADLLMRMERGTITLGVVKEVVEEHRALWERPREPLSELAQRGLIGELLVLQRLSASLPAASLISRWTGPANGLHDITDNDWAIEVKTYSAEPPRPTISKIAQLDHDIDKRLTLVGLHIAGANEGKTFPDFVEDALQWADAAGCKEHLEASLSVAGWHIDDADQYWSRFIPQRFVICPIRPETPVFPVSLRPSIPGTVTNIAYRLTLSDLEQLDAEEEATWAAMMEAGPWGPLDGGIDASNARSTHDLPAEALIRMDESLHLEFKSSVWHPYGNVQHEEAKKGMMKKLETVIVKAVSGLMNAEGGTLLIGLSDDGEVLGLENDMITRQAKDLDSYENFLVTRLLEEFGGDVVGGGTTLRITFPTVEEHQIARLDVMPAPRPVFLASGELPVRVGNSTRYLTGRDMWDYAKGRW